MNVINKYKSENKLCLANLFKNIICIENNANKYYITTELPEIINKRKFNDLIDFIDFIINTLHDELNKKQIKEQINYSDFKPNPTDPQEMLNHFINQFINNNKSIISDLFFGTFSNKITCLNCQTQKYNYEIFSNLIFPLDEVNEYKKSKLMLKNNLDIVTINDCFEFNQRIQLLSGEDAITCNICKTNSSNNYSSFIYTAPEILILIFEVNEKSNIKLEYNLDLNLYNNIIRRETGYKFNLIGVVSKVKESGVNECFIAYYRSQKDNCWYKYDNDIISKNIDFKKEIIDSGIPSILFYEKSA